MNISQEIYEAISAEIKKADSPVGIDAEKTHVLILHKLNEIEMRLTKIEAQLAATKE